MDTRPLLVSIEDNKEESTTSNSGVDYVLTADEGMVIRLQKPQRRRPGRHGRVGCRLYA